MTYAVLWSANDGPEFAGSLELTGGSVVLAGTAERQPDGQREAHREVRYDDLIDVYLERCAPAKHAWEPALVLVSRSGDQVAIGSLEGLGALHELAEHVAGTLGKTAA